MNRLEKTIALFRQIRSGIVEAMQNLYAIHESGEWESKFSSWGEFVESEDGLAISQGFASKLLTVNKHYLIEGGMTPDSIQGIDYEKLYIASKLPGEPAKQAEMARSLTRLELKETKNDDAPHEPTWVEFCSVCSIRRSNHK